MSVHAHVIMFFDFHLHTIHAGGRAYSNAYFGTGRGPIFLDDVQCTSSAKQLLACPSRPILSHTCLHSDDAGVGCEGTLYGIVHSLSVIQHITFTVLCM